MAKPKHRRQLRNFLLDSRFQLRFALIIVLVAAALTGALGYFWYAEMRTASRIVEVQALGMSEDDAREVKSDLQARDRTRLLVLVGFGVVLVVFLTGYGIVFTHKVAGPLFKIGRHMRDIRDENLQPVFALRKGDQLQEFWRVFKEMHSALRERQQREAERLSQVADALDGADDAERAAQLKAIRELAEHKRATLTEEDKS